MNTAYTVFLFSILSFLRSLLGILTQTVVAHQFGASRWTDAYVLALSIPQVLGDFMIGGCLIFAMVPLSLEIREREGIGAQRNFYSQVFFFLLLAAGAAACVYAFWAPQMVRRLAPGFDDSTLKSAVRMAKMLSPMILLFAFSHFFSGIFLARKQYFSLALAGFCYPLTLIGFCLWTEPFLGQDRLIYGTLLGAFAQMLAAVILCLKEESFAFRVCFVWNQLAKLFSLMYPIVWVVILNALLSFQQKFFASRTGEGGISCLNYAVILYGIPNVFIFSSLQTVLYPKFSEHAAKVETEKSAGLLARTIRFIFFTAVPVSGFLIILSPELVSIVYERGRFSASDAGLTAGLLRLLLFGLFAQSVNEISGRFFYSQQKAWAYVKVIAGSTLLGIAANPFFFERLGMKGLGLSASIVSMICFVGLLILLGRFYPELKIFKVCRYLMKTFLISLFPLAVVFFLKQSDVFYFLRAQGFRGAIFYTASLFSAGFFIYLALAWSAKQKEAYWLIDFLNPSNWPGRKSKR